MEGKRNEIASVSASKFALWLGLFYLGLFAAGNYVIPALFGIPSVGDFFSVKGEITGVDVLSFFDLTPFDFFILLPCIFCFFLLWMTLDKNLFRPYLSLLDEREASTTGALEQAAAAREEAENLIEEYSQKIQAAKVEALREKLDKIAKARKEAQKIIDKAEGEAEEHLRSIRWEINTTREDARAALLKDVNSLSNALVQKLTAFPRQAETQ